MKQLTNKELTLLGAIGYLLQEDKERWELMRERVQEAGYQEQIEQFQLRMLDSSNLEMNINDTLVSIVIDIIGEGDE